MAALNYISAVRDRILLLLARYEPTSKLTQTPANVSQIGDQRRKPVPTAKGSVGVSSDFYKVEFVVGTTTDHSYGDPDTLSQQVDPSTIDEDEPNDRLTQIEQDFLIVVTQDSINDAINAKLELEIAAAMHCGGRKLKDPNDANSAIAYVVSWGPITTTRLRKRVDGAVRQVSTITIKVYLQVYASELTT